jgi:hypothetical protein
MKKSVNFLTLFIIILLGAATLFSCQKEQAAETPATPESLLKAKTWIYDELTEYETGYPPEIIYKKGGVYNQLDLSRVETKFLDNGVWQYIDPFGRNGSGSWKLLANNTIIEFRSPATNSPEIGNEFMVTSTTFSYKDVESTGYSIHKLIPKP